ncbi:hypothetical protein PFICI_08296 [Pestalotiopsis fici W106-1]|uniref:F-box domain-containing protein n=1 Tax=Pestalotiopsis fici (strain W106-1 / CGMCC3.15140) TaxID=1229662 RepID=W3X5X1_PESFW|nr:uncharacterized protein PFICI_08296 [Pestalotiopsis fici W106-1]ETS80767.1 hypothetical protein PFICI_08296 [Pestalotiopsis fici W106-1]
MDAFPSEVLHIVFSHLELKDVGQFRLACKTFNDISAYIFFQNITFYLHTDDLRHLRHVTQKYPTCIRSLVYRGRTIVDEVCADDFAEQHSEYMILKYGRELEHSSDDLQEQYARYKDKLAAQRRLIDAKDDFRCLAEVIGSLPQLQSITVNPDVYFFPDHNPHNLKSPFDELFYECSQKSGFDLVRHVEAVFSALQRAAAKIEVLRLGPVHWRVIEHNVSVLSTPIQALSNLRHLELVFTLGKWSPCQASACREVVRSGALRSFLSTLPHLEVLNVDFSSIGHSRKFGASVDDIIPSDRTWRYLHSLALRNMEEGQQDFMSVMERHKESLREVCLSNIRLGEISLPVLLEEIRNTLSLSYTCICGFITGSADAQGKTEWLLLRSTIGGDWHRVINYCCRGSGSPKNGVCPISEDWDMNRTDDDKIQYEEIYQYEARFRRSQPFPGFFAAKKNGPGC